MIYLVLKNIIKNKKNNNKLISKTKQRFKSERHVFTEEIKKIPLSLNYDKRMTKINLIETYAYKMSKELVNEK